MKPYRIIIHFFLLLSAALISSRVSAQNTNQKEVFVVKPYEPVLSDAVKINFLPSVSDTLHVAPVFSYSILSQRIPTEYEVVPITAAKMVAESVPRLYKSYLKLGIGNYLTPLAELNISSLRSSKFVGGFYFRHLSSQWNYERNDKNKVDAGYANNDAALYGAKIMKYHVLKGEVDFSGNTVHYYGYNPLVDNVLDKNKIRQDILHGGASIDLASNYADSSRMNYQLKIGYGYTNLKDKHFEHAFNLGVNLKKMVVDNFLTGDINFSYFKPSMNIDTAYHALFEFKPGFSRRTSDWKFSLGLNLTADVVGGKSTFNIYPEGILEFTAIDKILIPYFGVTGYRQANDYYAILKENPFIMPSLSVKSSNYKIIAYGGLKGNMGTHFAYNLSLKYASVGNMYFYINNAADSLSLGNQFNTTYDDVEILNYRGEFIYNQEQKLTLSLSGEYNQYTLSKLDKPFQKDILDFTLKGRYNLMDKIIAGASVYYVGKRFALPLNGTGYAELKGIADINLSLEYRYTKLLSVFLHINNLAASRYYQWYQYPLQRFNFMAGFTYAL